MKRLFLIGALAAAGVGLWYWRAMAAENYEQAYAPTEPGEIEVKTLPEATIIRSSSPGGYFAESNGLFMPLFRYIEKRDIAMTTPVEAEIDPGTMAFFIGRDVPTEALTQAEGIEIERVPERRVLSVGIRGGYSEENYQKAREQAAAWLAQHPQWQPDGAARMVYWNGPFVPSWTKRSELHLPVRPTE
ncbi:MAG: heme-binding protein [Verrucomicrobiota bacterium]